MLLAIWLSCYYEAAANTDYHCICQCYYVCILLIGCTTNWELRLVGGTNVREGRLEVCLNGVWGTVCDQSWDNTDAGVVCTELGYSRQG